MLAHWIWFAHRPGLSDRAKAELLACFQDAEDVFYADPQGFSSLPLEHLSKEGEQALHDKNLLPAEEILEVCAREKLHILTYRDAAYPARLRNIPDPPMALYYKGQLPDFDGVPLIGVVGTRKASAYGLTTAKRMGYQIGKCGGVVVSGMAYGIDGMAMSGALTAGGTAVGVLGCGADVIYPASNKALFHDTEQYGCLLSEFPPGTPPAKWNFPKRNRIISGLCNGVLVVEAPEKSGALITARLAAEQGRDVFVVPGNIDMPSFVGSNRLLRDGAIMVSSGWDVLSEYEALYPEKLHESRQQPVLRAYPEEVLRASEPEEPMPKVAQKPLKPREKTDLKKNLDKKAIDKPASTPYSGVNKPCPPLSDTEAAVLAALESGERLVDDMIAQTGLSTGKLLAVLTMLEIKGIIERLPGKRVRRKY